MKKKIIFLLLLSSVALTGCFGDSSEKEKKVSEGFRLYEASEFTMHVPNDWEEVKPVSFRKEVSRNTIVAFRNNIRNGKFTANVAVLKNLLSSETDSLQYAKSLYEKVKNEIIGPREILAQSVKIAVDGKETETLFTHVEGQEKPDSEILRILHVSAVSGKTAYIAVGSFLPAEADTVGKKVEEMVRSLEVK